MCFAVKNEPIFIRENPSVQKQLAKSVRADGPRKFLAENDSNRSIQLRGDSESRFKIGIEFNTQSRFSARQPPKVNQLAQSMASPKNESLLQ